MPPPPLPSASPFASLTHMTCCYVCKGLCLRSCPRSSTMSTIFGRACAGRRGADLLLAGAACLLMTLSVPAAVADPLPSEIPAAFVPRADSYDYVKREVMIPMRDG